MLAFGEGWRQGGTFEPGAVARGWSFLLWEGRGHHGVP